MRPTNRVGMAVAISIRPTLSAEPVRRNTRMPAASEVRALPIVETNWPVHISVNDRLRKTAKGENERELAAAVTGTSCGWGELGIGARSRQFALRLSIS